MGTEVRNKNRKTISLKKLIIQRPFKVDCSAQVSQVNPILAYRSISTNTGAYYLQHAMCASGRGPLGRQPEQGWRSNQSGAERHPAPPTLHPPAKARAPPSWPSSWCRACLAPFGSGRCGDTGFLWKLPSPSPFKHRSDNASETTKNKSDTAASGGDRAPSLTHTWQGRRSRSQMQSSGGAWTVQVVSQVPRWLGTLLHVEKELRKASAAFFNFFLMEEVGGGWKSLYVNY